VHTWVFRRCQCGDFLALWLGAHLAGYLIAASLVVSIDAVTTSDGRGLAAVVPAVAVSLPAVVFYAALTMPSLAVLGQMHSARPTVFRVWALVLCGFPLLCAEIGQLRVLVPIQVMVALVVRQRRWEDYGSPPRDLSRP
jgi:hypothetical protein